MAAARGVKSSPTAGEDDATVENIVDDGLVPCPHCNRRFNEKAAARHIPKCLEIKAKINLLPMQPGDVQSTHADVSDLIDDFEYKPSTDIKVGVNKFVSWYKEYYKI